MNEDEMTSSTDVRETRRGLIQSQYRELAGETTRQGGDDMLRYLTFILEGKGRCCRF